MAKEYECECGTAARVALCKDVLRIVDKGDLVGHPHHNIPREFVEDIKRLRDELKTLRGKRDELLSLAESAWGVIANAGASNWERESAEWQEAAARWRERYHTEIGIAPRTTVS